MVTSADEKGNKTIGEYKDLKSKIRFIGKNNSITFGKNVTLKQSNIFFHCDNSHIVVNDNSIVMTNIGIGYDCSLRIGRNVTFTGSGIILLAESTEIDIGDSCLIAKGVTIRTDDSHPIFSVTTKKRVNNSKSIHIDNNVWIGEDATVMKGVRIRQGSVVGTKSVVTKLVPNNCCVAGNPAKVINRDIAWTNHYLRSPLWNEKIDGNDLYDDFIWKTTENDEDSFF